MSRNQRLTRAWFEAEWHYLQRDADRPPLPLNLRPDELALLKLETLHGARAWLRRRLEQAQTHADAKPPAA